VHAAVGGNLPPCPSRERLAQLLAEQLFGPEVDQIEGHVESCARCQQTLGDLSDGDLTGTGSKPPHHRSTLSDEPRPEFLLFLGQVDPADEQGANDGQSGSHTLPRSEGLPRTPNGNGRTHVAGYDILAELGRGGTGVVYQAHQLDLGRLVALKVLLAGAHASPHDLLRFHTEAETVARFQHPNIVQIYDIGEENGCPYLALEYVEGGSLATKFQGTPLPPRQAAELVQTLARAIHAAHQRGIVHRDLKPANVLLTTDGVPKITDFGLAKRLDADTRHTQTGAVLGTPDFMAPEQAEGKTVGPPADIHALGAILYLLLTGHPPFPAATPVDTMMRVRLEEPVAPTVLQRKVPRDIETICLKCLRKEPRQRYASADSLAEDLHRFLNDRPILARRSLPSERAWRWCRRNPIVASLTGSVVLLLAVLLGTSVLNNARLEEELKRTERAEKEKTEKLWDSYLANAQASRWSGRPGRRFEGLAAVRAAAAIRPDLRLRNEAIALMTLPDVRVACEIKDGFPPGTASVTFDLDFEYYARSDVQGNISVRRVADDEEAAVLQGFGTHAWKMTFSPDGRFLHALYNEGSCQRIWEWRSARIVLEAEIAGGADFSPDSAMAAVGQTDGWIALYELPGGTLVKRLQAGVPYKFGYGCAFHSDGTLAVTQNEPPALMTFDVDTGKRTSTKPLDKPMGLTWQRGGDEAPGWPLVLVGPEQLTVCRARPWTQQAVLSTPDAHTTSACFGPRDGLLASTGWDQMLRLWDTATKRQLLALHGSVGANFDRTGSRLASTRQGAALRLWEVIINREFRLLNTPEAPVNAAWGADFSPDGALLAEATNSGVTLWHMATGRNLATLPTGFCSGAVFAPDGTALFTRTTIGVQRWPISTIADRVKIGPPERIISLPWDSQFGTLARASGGKLAANDRTSKSILMVHPHPDPDTLTGQYRVALPDQPGAGYRLAASPDGRWIANTSYWDFPDKLRVSDVSTRKVVWTYPAAIPGSFSPDSRWLVTGGDACRIRETGTWRLERTITAPPELGAVVDAVFAPDGVTLAIAHEGRAVRLVDARSGEELAILPAPDLPKVDRLCFSSDGGRLACAVEKAGVQLWDLRRIRAELADMGLDWDLPALPPANETGAITEVTVDAGKTAPPETIAARNDQEAQAHQQAWADYFSAPVEVTNSLAMKLRLVPNGSESFYCGSTKVTVGQFRQFVEDTQYKTTAESNGFGGVKISGDEMGQKRDPKREYCWSHPAIALGEDHPVTMVTWQDAMAFCDWLSKREGYTYRLATREEWQRAAKAESTTRYYFGDDVAAIDDYAWHAKNSDWHTHPVGGKKPNAWGLYDMYGNAWETCLIWQRSNGQPADPDHLRPGPGPLDKTLVVGGSYGDGEPDPAYTAWGTSSMPHSHFGFRVILAGDVRSVPVKIPAKPSSEEKKRSPFGNQENR
jgi:eukaryotic-like serine/threonine-protein kinase